MYYLSWETSISNETAIELINEALKKDLYIDGVSLLCEIYLFKDENKYNYWKKILDDLEEKGQPSSPSIEPKFLVTEYLKDKNV